MSEPNELLAGLSILTILNLKHSDPKIVDEQCITSAGPHPNGKFAGWITSPGGRQPMVSTKPLFDTAALAEEHMRKIVAAAREFIPPSAPASDPIELFAWVGEDEYKPGEYGLKSGLTPVGWIPLVSVKLDRMNDPELVAQQQKIANQYQKGRKLVKFTYGEVILDIVPGTPVTMTTDGTASATTA